MSLSEPTVGGLEPTPVRQGGPPARAVIGVFAIGLVVVVGIGLVGQSPRPTPDVPASLAAVASPTPSPTVRPTPTPAPTLRLGGCRTGLAPIGGEIARHPRPLQPPPLIRISTSGGAPYQVVASGDAFWILGQGRLTRADRTGATTGQWDYLDDPAFGSSMIGPARGGGVWLWGLGDIRWFDGTGFADTLPPPPWTRGDLSGVAEAPDGSVWATTYQGSAGRWDGVAWAAVCDDHGGSRDGSTRLALDPDGTVWILDGADLVHYDATGATLATVAIPDLDRYGAESMTVSADGALWVASSQLVQRFDGQWTTMHDPQSAPIGATYLGAADDGSVWAAAGSGDGSCCPNIARFDGTGTRLFSATEGLGASPDGVGIWAIAGHGGDVVAATNLGTYRIPVDLPAPGAWPRFGPVPSDSPDTTSVSAMVVEGSDRLLVATWDRLWEVRGDLWKTVDLPGLPPGYGSVDGLVRSADGTVAVATSVGAMARTDGRWEVLEPRPTLAIAFDSAGACWLAPGGSDPNTGNTLQEHALYRFTRRDARWVRSTVAVPDEVASIDSLVVGPDGDVWLRGMRGEIPALWQRHGKRWVLLPGMPGTDAYWSSRRMVVTADGDLVLGSGGTEADPALVAYRYDGSAWSLIDATGSVPSYGGNDLAAAADGTVWVTAGGSGLTRTGGKDGDLQLPGAFGAIALDAQGTAYVAGPSGIYRVRR
jgi:hypothetical protein